MKSKCNFFFIKSFLLFALFLLLINCEDNPEEDCAGVPGGSNICGCMDSTALNFNFNATSDNDSCLYDTESPTIQITSYFSDPVIDTITITMMATDNVGIEKVELWFDGAYTGFSDSSEPYEFNFDTKLIENGLHTIIGRAFDISGNYADSGPQILTVGNDYTPPQVEIAEDQFEFGSDTLEVEVYAYDQFGIDTLELLVDGLSTGLSPYLEEQISDTYRFYLPTQNYSNGIHTLTAIAHDIYGNSTISEPIDIYMYNPPALLLQSSATDLSVGDSSVVSINLERFPEIFAISLQISYNDSLLLIDQSMGFNSGTFFGENNIVFSNIQSSTIYLTNSLTQGQETVSGFGNLGSLTFNAQSVGQDTLEIVDYHFYDSDGNEFYIGEYDSDLIVGSLEITVN